MLIKSGLKKRLHFSYQCMPMLLTFSQSLVIQSLKNSVVSHLLTCKSTTNYLLKEILYCRDIKIKIWRFKMTQRRKKNLNVLSLFRYESDFDHKLSSPYFSCFLAIKILKMRSFKNKLKLLFTP